MNKIILVHLSDTHLRELNNLPGGDVLAHTGDFLNYGSVDELARFIKELESVAKRYTEVWIVPGNHDIITEDNPELAREMFKAIPNVILLDHKAYEYKGFKVFGTPYQPFFCNWGWNIKSSQVLEGKYNDIPDDVEILLTHCPSYGILDRTPRGELVGSRELKAQLPRLKNLKVHAFGHIHNDYGYEVINEVTYSNASICDERYIASNEPRVIDVWK